MAQKKYATVIFGCGNRIMGDDGFGPAVVEKLKTSYTLPRTVAVVDAGTAVREYLFDYLLSAESRPESIIILDAVDMQKKMPGEVFFITPAAVPAKKIHDFSLHQFPSVNLLSELVEHTGMSVSILAAQVEYIPDEIEPGLSPAVAEAVPVACEKIMQLLAVN